MLMQASAQLAQDEMQHYKKQHSALSASNAEARQVLLKDKPDCKRNWRLQRLVSKIHQCDSR